MTEVSFRRAVTTGKCLTCNEEFSGEGSFAAAEYHSLTYPGHDTEVYMTEIARISSPAGVTA